MGLFDFGNKDKLYEKGLAALEAKERRKAAEFFLKAGEKGHAKALYYAGELYDYVASYDLTVDGKNEEKLRLFLRGAELGDPDCMYMAAVEYSTIGLLSGKKDYDKMIMWAERAIAAAETVPMMEKKSSCEQFLQKVRVEKSYADGLAASERGDRETALKLLTDAADKKMTKAAMRLAAMYEDGICVEKDEREALRWYQRAVELRDLDAMEIVAKAYIEGRLVEKDNTKALALAKEIQNFVSGKLFSDSFCAKYRKKAEALIRRIEAEDDLASAAQREKAGDDKEAERLYTKAANAGIAAAMHALALLYDRQKKYEESFPWHLKAARAGDVEAMADTADSLYYGDGTEPDTDKALFWAEKAAEAGSTRAQDLIDQIREEQRTRGFQDALKALGKGDTDQAIRLFSQSAEAGSAASAWNLSLLYANGDGVPKDEKAGFRWCLKAAELGHSKAMLTAAKSYFNGRDGAEVDLDQALFWAEKAKRSGGELFTESVDGLIREIRRRAALRSASKACADGRFTEAVPFLTTAAETGSEWASEVLGYLYEEGKGVGQDEQEAFRRYLDAAQAGSKSAMRTVALRYASGTGGAPRDAAEAAKWIERAGGERAMRRSFSTDDPAMRLEADALLRRASMAEYCKDIAGAVRAYKEAVEKGSIDAAVTLADNYDFGAGGCEKNEEEAFRWRLRAAEMGRSEACLTVAFAYAQGRYGAPKDAQQALYWAQKAKDGGGLESHHALVLDQLISTLNKKLSDPFVLAVEAHQQGDMEKAKSLYETAAEQGDPAAAFNLAVLHETGDGVPQNKQEGLRWFRRAAELGEPRAMYNLAARLAFGGYDADFDEAKRWAEKAKASGKLDPKLPVDDLIADIEEKRLMKAAFEAGKRGEYAEEVRLMKCVAERGSAIAAARLGTMYMNGEDVARDDREGFRWTLRAAELGEVQSMTIVAAGYCLGRGTAKDPRKAIAWAKKAKATGKLDGRGVSVMNEVIEMSEKAL